MKLRSIGSLALLAFLGCGGSGSSDHSPPFFLAPRWANQQRIPTSSHLRAVRFNSPTQGFIAGESSSLYRTDDGGLSWIQEEHSPFDRGGDIAALDFFGTELQAVGVDPSNGLGRRWSSTDALNWTTADAPGALAKFVSVDVTPSITGGTPYVTYALREDWTQYIQSGASSGESTTLSTLVGATADKATAVDMLGNGPGYVVGENGRMYETSNWANNWTVVAGTGANALRDVQILAAGIVFACGDNGTLLWTENGGAVAALVGGPATTWRGVHFFHAFQDTSVGWVVGNGGQVRRVSGVYDAMTMIWTWTWSTPAGTGTSENLYDVHVVANPGTSPQEYTGYAVGDNGAVVKLVDNGTSTTMSLLTAGSTDTINAVSFDPTGTRGVAVGDNGKVYKTLNGGAFWSEVDLGAMKWTGASIPPGNSNVAFICGEGGEVRRNLDLELSNTWTAAGGLGATNFRAILFPSSADVGFVVGDGSTLLYTNTGGQIGWSWTNPTVFPAVTTDYRALSTNFLGGGTGLFAAGTNGVIVTQSLGSYALPWGVHAPAGSFGNATHQTIQSPTSAILFSAVDFGGTRLQRRLGVEPAGPFVWEGASQPASGPPTAAGLAFPSQSFGWWVSDGIYTTENAANALIYDWKTSPTHTKGITFNGVWMSASGTVGYVVGTNGTILKTTTGGK